MPDPGKQEVGFSPMEKRMRGITRVLLSWPTLLATGVMSIYAAGRALPGAAMAGDLLRVGLEMGQFCVGLFCLVSPGMNLLWFIYRVIQTLVGMIGRLVEIIGCKLGRLTEWVRKIFPNI
jgi:hypothetical protein